MKVLVAEDDEIMRHSVVRFLRMWGFTEVIEAPDGECALDALMNPGSLPSLALLDWVLPGLHGVDVCRKLRAVPDVPFVYVILLSGRHRVEDIVDGLDAGADDYLVKPFDPHELRSRIRAGERILALERRLTNANALLRQRARTDDLTKQMNRPAILERLSEELSRAARQQQPLAVLMADIDRFKQINDTYGHVAGDVVLREFAHRLSGQLRPYDAVGRYGGEEFLCILPGLPWPSCGSVVERMRLGVSGVPIPLGMDEITVTASFGLAWSGAGEQHGIEEMIQTADRMLYQAKENGRDCIEAGRVADSAGSVLLRGAARDRI